MLWSKPSLWSCMLYLYCWKVDLCYSFKSFAASNTFSSRTVFWAESILPVTLTSCPFPAEKKHDAAITMFQHSNSVLGLMCIVSFPPNSFFYVMWIIFVISWLLKGIICPAFYLRGSELKLLSSKAHHTFQIFDVLKFFGKACIWFLPFYSEALHFVLLIPDKYKKTLKFIWKVINTF